MNLIWLEILKCFCPPPLDIIEGFRAKGPKGPKPPKGFGDSLSLVVDMLILVGIKI